VWTRYQQAIKDGVIISAGERKANGKGKPSKLWRVNPNPPVPNAAPVVTAITPSTPTPAPVPAAPPQDTPVPTEPVVVPAVTPTTPPVSTESPVVETPTVLPTSTETPVENITAPVVENSTMIEAESITVPIIEVNANAQTENKENLADAWQVDETCPVCGNKLWAIKDATGIQVWCDKPQEVCGTFESPAGHGKNVKDAFAVILAKFGPAVKA